MVLVGRIGQVIGFLLILISVVVSEGKYSFFSGNRFEPNTGQIADMEGRVVRDVFFYGRGEGFDVYVGEKGVSYVLRDVQVKGDKFDALDFESRMSGDVFAVGYTASTNFLTYNPGVGVYYQENSAIGDDGFILKSESGPMLTQVWVRSAMIAEPGSSMNAVNVRLIWNDGNAGQTHGISTWTFDVTSSGGIMITGVSLHSSIQRHFNITTKTIANGLRVLIDSKSPNQILQDAGDGPASYIVVVVSFNAPTNGDTGKIRLTNLSATKREANPPYTASFQSFANASDTLTVIISSSPTPGDVPTGTPPTIGGSPNYPAGTKRKYGDINWDGNVDVSDVTAMEDVVIRRFSAVTVYDSIFGGQDKRRKFYEQPEGENPIDYDNSNNNSDPDVLDAIISDVYRANGDPDPSFSPYPEPRLTPTDLDVLKGAVLKGMWPSHAIPPIAGKPAYKAEDRIGDGIVLAKREESERIQVNRVGVVRFELFNPKKWNSKVRVMFENRIDSVRGLQIELKLDGLPRFIEVWRMVGAGYNVSWAKGDHGKLVVLVYAEEGRYMESGERVLFVISAPELDVKDLIDSEPRVIASVANLSEYVSFRVEGFAGGLPLEYELYQNYPNPFNMETEIRYDVPEYSEVKIIVWNVLGQRVRVLVDGRVDPGRKVVRWDGKDEGGRYVGSGVYFYTMYARSLDRKGKEFVKTRKAILLK